MAGAAESRLSEEVQRLRARVHELERERLANEPLQETEKQLALDLEAVTRLHKLGTFAVTEANLELILAEIVDAAIVVSGADFGNIQLLDTRSSNLRIVAQRGFPEWWLDFWNRVSKGLGVCGTALERGERVIVEDVEQSQIFADTPALQIQLKVGVRAIQSTPLFSRSGKLIGMFSTHYKRPHRPAERTLQLLDLLGRQAADIVERVQVETALRESEERFRALVNASSYAVYRMSADWAEMRELDGKGFIANTKGPSRAWLQEYIDLNDQAHVVEGVQKAIRTKSMFELEHRVRRIDGTSGWALSRAVPILDPNGEIVEWFGTASDITERRRAQAALSESEARLKLALIASAAGVWSSNARTNQVQWDDQHQSLFGFAPGAPVSLKTWLASLHPQDRPRIAARIREMRRTPSDDTWDMEYRVLLPSGRVVWIHSLGHAGRDAAGQILNVVGINLDITKRKRMEVELARQAQLKDEFLAQLGHELRNPLAAISTAMQLLSSGVTAERRTTLEELTTRQVEVLRRLVDDLLDIGRITQGHVELKKDRIDLSKLLQGTAATVQSSIAARGQRLLIQLPPEHVLFMADGVRLEQVIVNLLSNASKYTDKGGKIELSGAKEGSEIVIQCKDNGSGVPLEMQQAIFEPFIRVQRATGNREPGVGLGLSVVKRLMELHGGTVSVVSRGPGTGSEFTVRLPLVEAPPPRQPPPGRRRAQAGRALSIVLVEDSFDVAQTLKIALEQAGHRVRSFTDGPSALSGLPRLRPAAVLLDIGLPGMDGYELLAKLRKRRSLQQTLFVGMSGFQRRARAVKVAGDFDHYFVKPVDLKKLLNLLDTCAGPKEASTDKLHGESTGVNPLRVLLVEDHVHLAEVTAEMIRQEGLEVRIAHSGREALAAVAGFRPELILCDLHLPDMSGKDVVQALRSDPATRRTHTVILTASCDMEVRALQLEAKGMGIDEFISKPLSPDAIRDLLAKLRPSRHAK